MSVIVICQGCKLEQEHQARGLCANCYEQQRCRDPDRKAKMKQYHRTSYLRHIEERHRKGRIYYWNNQEKESLRKKRFRQENKELYEKQRIYYYRYVYEANNILALDILCNSENHKCAWCNERDLLCLHIDHINGKGTKARERGEVNSNLPIWIINHPEEARKKYQVLCSNCNFRKRNQYEIKKNVKYPLAQYYHEATSIYAFDIICGSEHHSCIRCGETDRACLQFDHINGDGRKHRKEIGTQLIAKWILKNQEEAKARLQVLCVNCNWLKRHKNKER